MIPRIRFRSLVLPLLFLTSIALIGCDGGPSSSSPPDDDATLDFSGSFDGTEVVLERVVNDTPDGRVEIDLVALRIEVDPSSGRVELDVALRNRSNRAVGLPAIVFLGAFTPAGTRVVNSDNQLIDIAPGVEPPRGPYPDWFDYSGTFGDDGLLSGGETSDIRTWIVSVEGGGSFAFGAAVRVGLDPERATISGLVFLDENANGQVDDNELPFGAGIVELMAADGSMQRTQVAGSGEWRLAIRRPGLYTARWISPPTLSASGPFAPFCATTPNPLEILVVGDSDGEPASFAGANFGLKSFPCDPPNDDVVNLTSGPPDSIATDNYALLDARIIASPDAPTDGPPTTWFLEVRVGFSGCSGDHPFLAFAGDDFMDTNPPSTWLRLQHDDRGELCEAWFEETRLFNLTPLVRRYEEIFGNRIPNFTMELTGPRGESFQLSLP